MTAVYEWFDSTDVLLYIGVSEAVPRRAGEHEKEKAWWKDVARAKVTHYPTREEALRVERVLIQHHRPTYNIAHNGVSVYRESPVEGVTDELNRDSRVRECAHDIVEHIDEDWYIRNHRLNTEPIRLALQTAGLSYSRFHVREAMRVLKYNRAEILTGT